MNNPGGGGADLWGTSDAGGDDATLNDLLALYQSASDMPPPFAPLADTSGLGEALPEPGAAGGAVDAEIDELIKSFQEAPAVFPPGPSVAPLMPPAIEVSVAPIPPAAPPLAADFGVFEAITEPPGPSFDVSAPPAPPMPVFEAPAPPAPPRPSFDVSAPAIPPMPTFEPPAAVAPPAPPAPPHPTFEPPAAVAPPAPPAPPRPTFEPPAAVAPPAPPAPPRPAFEPPAAVVPPAPPAPPPTSFEDLIQSVVPANDPPSRPPATVTVAPVRPAPPRAVAASSGSVPALPAVEVGSSRQRLALAQQLTEVIANLAGGVDQVQGDFDQLYSTLARAASERAPVEEILQTTQALSDAKARVGEGSELYQQALLLKAVGEAYIDLLRSI